MNNYHIYEKLGRGKHSTVYKGRKKKSINYFAIKSVDKDQKARVLQEVRTMHALDHKNVLKFFAWYETTNHLWLILEYCVGGDLLSLLRQDVRLPESSVHDFARDLVVSMQYLHSNSIIYCDLKPSNILLDENGRLKLGGFGLSRRLSDINKTPFTTLPQAKRGTPCYMAPELFSDDATHSTASDLWALGCVMYECAMGRAPFMSSTLTELMQDILNKEPPPIPGASPEFTDLITRLIDKNPATRIKWPDLIVHPFWQVRLPLVSMPPEPMLEAFIAKYHLAPMGEEKSASVANTTAGDRAKSLRQSVDITRLSRIALHNLEKEGDGGMSDYTAAEAQPGGIRIESADAELDFEEQRDDGAADEEEPPSPTVQNDEGSVIDQGDGGTSGSGRVMPDSMVASEGTNAAIRSSVALARRRGDAGGAGSPKGAQGQTPTPAGESATLQGSGGGGEALQTGGIEGLIWHSSDVAVKPIVANRRIERLPEPKYEPKALTFPAMSLQDLLRADHKDLESFLTHIYRAIASAAPLKDKVNVLSYFETLCTDNNAANSLINSSLTILFIRMLRNARAPTLRIRLASVLGLLIRHATYIADELAQTSVVEILTEALKDKNEKVRRRVMATLGELLFYIATTQQDVPGGGTVQEAADLWGLNTGTITSVVRLLKPQEDEIAQHYAVKTIENICSQGGDWAARFCSEDLVFNLVQIYNSTKNENLKATAASTLARLLRHNPALVSFVVDKIGVRLFVAGIADSSSKVQTACVNMLNLVTSQPDLSVRAKTSLGEERGVVPGLMALLDHALPVLRAKGVVAILLLCRLSARWLLETCKAKLIPAIERLQREREDEYLQQTVSALRDETARLVPVICMQINEELKPGFRKSSSFSSTSRPAPTKSPMLLFPIVLHLITSPHFRPTTVTPQLIVDLATYLKETTGAPPSASQQAVVVAEFKASLMHVLEAICQQTELVLQHYAEMLRTLLPAVCEVIAAPSESGDTRFFCLRMASEVTQLYLMDAELYGGASPTTGIREEDAGSQGAPGLATQAIDTLLRGHIFPTIPKLLQDEDPMPLYALKLLGGLLEVNQGYVRDIEQMGLASQFFDFLSLEHANNNVHNIRLCRQVVSAGAMTASELLELQVSERVAAVVEYAAQNNVEPFLEPVLELSHAIMTKELADMEAAAARGGGQGTGGGLTAVFLDQAVTFLELCTRLDSSVCRVAALCVLDLVLVFPQQVAPWILSPESLTILINVLEGQGEALEGGSGCGPAPPALQQPLLEALLHATAEPDCLQGVTEELMGLKGVVQHIATSGDPVVRTLAGRLADAIDVYL